MDYVYAGSVASRCLAKETVVRFDNIHSMQITPADCLLRLCHHNRASVRISLGLTHRR